MTASLGAPNGPKRVRTGSKLDKENIDKQAADYMSSMIAIGQKIADSLAEVCTGLQEVAAAGNRIASALENIHFTDAA